MRRRFLSLFGAFLLSVAGSLHAAGLTLSDIETAARRNVRDTASSSSLQRYSNTVLDSIINEGQRDVVSNTWILSKSTSITLSANTTYYTLPSDTIAIQRVTRQFGNLPEVTLAQQDADNGDAAWEVTGGTPTYFFQDKSQTNKIGLTPYPNSANTGTLNVIYYAYAVDLSVGTDVPFNNDPRFTIYHDLLVWYTTYRLMFIEALWDKAKAFKDMYDTRLGVLLEDYGAKPQRVPALPQKDRKP